MRDVDEVRLWRTALEDLKNSRTEIEGMEDDVFSCLKFSFDRLKTDRLRDCFLYCALYPEDRQIRCDELIGYWMAEGLIDEMGNREKEFDKGYTIINNLLDACLLEKEFHPSGISMIKMHDLLRDLAIGITRKSSQLTKDVTRISLMNNIPSSLEEIKGSKSLLEPVFMSDIDNEASEAEEDDDDEPSEVEEGDDDEEEEEEEEEERRGTKRKIEEL